MVSTTPTSPGEWTILIIGLLVMFYGTFKVWKTRGRPGSLIVWGGLADLGLALMGLGLGLSGDVGAILIIVYHGVARLAAWMGLAGLVANPWTCVADDVRGALYRNPVGAILLAFALEASLGISPTFSPEGQHLILHAMAIHSLDVPLSGPILAILMALAYTVVLWLSAEVVLEVCFTTPQEAAIIHARKAGSFASDIFSHQIATTTEKNWCPLVVKRWATHPSAMNLYVLLGILVILGLGRNPCQDIAAYIVGVSPDALVSLESGWSFPAIFLYVLAFFVLCPFLVKPKWRSKYVIGVMVITFILTLFWSISPLSRLFGVIITGVGILIAWYSCDYIKEDERKPWYWFFLMLTFGALLTIVTANNIGMVANFWEIMTWASFALVAWEQTEQARKAALKYVILCCGAAYVMIVGFFMMGGNATFYNDIIAGISLRPDGVMRFALVFMLLGFMAKAGMFPLHSWLPDAHPAAPSSISAPLSGVLTKIGVFGMVLIYGLLVGQQDMLNLGRIGGLTVPGMLAVIVGIATMAVGEISALFQTDIKRMLAYSTMGQVGEIVTVLGVGTWLAMNGALAHVLNHAIMKDLLFLCAGALILRTGSRELKDLAGIGRRMPWTTTCMVIGILSIMGLPPFNGFISKYLMIVACMDAGQPVVAAALIIASLIGAVYYMRILRTILFDPEPIGGRFVLEAPMSMRWPLGILAALCVLFGIVPQSGLALVTPVTDMLAAVGTPSGAWGGVHVMPNLCVSWPCYVIVAMIGAIVPFLLRDNPKRAGRSAAYILILSALLTLIFGRDLDTISFCMAFIVPVIGAINLFYSVGYMEHSHTQWRFYTFFMLMCGGLAGVAASPDLFSFFMFWEIMSSWTLYFVISHEGTRDAVREGFKYFLFNIAGAGCLFLGVGILIACTGTSRFDLLRPLVANLPICIGTAVFALLTLGFLMKAAQLSLRIDWQMHPDLAPTPVSGYISSVLLKIAVFGMAKLFIVFGGAALILQQAPAIFHQDTIMYIAAWIGAFTLLYSALQAMIQVRLKLVFIWSTVSQIGYMVLGVACGTALGMTGGLLHLANHIFFKDLLFLMVGAVMFRTHMDTIYELGGLGKKMPITMFCFFIGALAVIGVPPTSGFTSKWIIYQALMQSGEPLLALISLIGSVITLAYLARFLHIVFLGRPVHNFDDVQEAPRIMLVPMLILAALTILSGIFPGIFLTPIAAGLAEYGLPEIPVTFYGLTTGAGAWNATLATVLILVAFFVVWFILHHRLSLVPVRNAEPHACGHDANLAASPMPADSVYGVMVQAVTGKRPAGRDFILRELARTFLKKTCCSCSCTNTTSGEGPSC